ncbi:glutathione S-transferase family protein [Phenylobacterium sp.]|jgi:glutathione S-transferase|uniref:glutathione S-transferase family protein n=1 Tax=Phenylobacterium sp. TaxID=1871053 RepID=UPI0025FEB165|nr:glutathione S-transferase family protein [Phenylobacterium sp.]MCA3719509.1 glutathione S-transferase family protein [Phenylobacterium sp.]
MELVIGSKRWSSWSMRPWLSLKRTGAEFRERLISLYQADGQTRLEILPHSPSGRVPALKTGRVVIPESLAICEYLAETFPDARLWPADADLRALGRAAASEMHAGFRALRLECPMDLARPLEAVALSEEALADIARVRVLWTDLLTRSGGPFLLGEWSNADAFFTPVATRFRTYAVDPGSPLLAAYMDRLLSWPDFLEWEAAGRLET